LYADTWDDTTRSFRFVLFPFHNKAHKDHTAAKIPQYNNQVKTNLLHIVA
jgi:hypothetical protein